MQPIPRMAAIGLATALLAACSSEPSSGDIETAVKAQVQQGLDAAQKMVGNNPQLAKMAEALQVKVHGVNKIGCKSAGDKAFLCDVELDLESGLTGRAKKTVPVRMVKGSEGWAISGL